MFKKVCMVFAGDAVRGNRFKKVAIEQGWQMYIAEWPDQAIGLCVKYEPDIVIIDDFPESEEARSLFYQLRIAGKGPFLLLNDSPGEMRFSALGALSFLQMIERDPKPEDLISAIIGLIESYCRFYSRQFARSSQVKKSQNRRIYAASVSG